MAAWLAAVQRELADLRQLEYTPLLRIQDWSEIPRSLRLFESLVVFQNYPMDGGAPPSQGTLRIVPFAQRFATGYPLTLVADASGDLRLRFYFPANRFDAGTVDLLLRQLAAVLRALPEQDDRTAWEIPLLNAEEQREITTEAELGPGTLHGLVAEQARRTPEAVALRCRDEALSYKDLVDRAGRLALFLRARGVDRGTRLGLSPVVDLEGVVALLAALTAGATLVPLAASLSAAALAALRPERSLQELRATAGDAPLGAAGGTLGAGHEIGFDHRQLPRGHRLPDRRRDLRRAGGRRSAAPGLRPTARSVTPSRSPRRFTGRPPRRRSRARSRRVAPPRPRGDPAPGRGGFSSRKRGSPPH